MNIIERIKQRARKEIKKIVLPEAQDIRILRAAELIQKEEFAQPILIGKVKEVIELAEKNHINLENIEIIDPKEFKDLELLIERFYELRKNKGISMEEAKKIMTTDYIYFGNMLVKEDYADGLVCGSICTSSDSLRPALQIIKTADHVKVASSFFLIELENKILGKNGCFIYSDCGMIQNPTSEELVEIAAASAQTFQLLLEDEATIALLSHSTMGSSNCLNQEKVATAVSMAKMKYPHLNLDGEMQFDAAIIPEVAKMKAPNSKVAGHANCLIFPNLDAGNIGYKITQRLANANSYGPMTQGLKKPINDLSRGCSVEDIVGVVAITALQAQKKNIE